MLSLHKDVSILDAAEQVLVNPANGDLAHVGGLAAIIKQAALAGDEAAAAAWHSDHDAAPVPLATGTGWWTRPGALSFEGVAHVFGPVWRGGDNDEAGFLRDAHEAAILLMREHDCTSIAFPAVSCGIFGYPAGLAAGVAVRTVARCLRNGESAGFYLIGEPHYQAFAGAMNAVAA